MYVCFLYQGPQQKVRPQPNNAIGREHCFWTQGVYIRARVQSMQTCSVVNVASLSHHVFPSPNTRV